MAKGRCSLTKEVEWSALLGRESEDAGRIVEALCAVALSASSNGDPESALALLINCQHAGIDSINLLPVTIQVSLSSQGIRATE